MIILKDTINEIFRQGDGDAPIEACGYLLGCGGDVRKAVPMINVDQSSEHFALVPGEQFAVIRQARLEGLEIIAVYHTHPATPARPSAEDIKLAFDPNIIYVIASLAPKTRAVKAFRIAKGEVSEEEITVKEFV